MSADSAPAAARSWWPLATAVVLFVLVSFPQLAQPDLASLYRDPLVLGTTIAAAIAAIGLFAAYRFASIAAETMETLWLSFAVGIAFWLSLIETAVPVAADRPVLGICLGAQLLAHAAGAKVYPNTRPGATPDAPPIPAPEIGWGPVSFPFPGGTEPIAFGLGDGVPMFHWHFDTFDLPKLPAPSPVPPGPPPSHTK